MKVLYLIGPYSGAVDKNVADARAAATALRKAGYAVIVPHLESLGCEDAFDYEGWMRHGIELMKRADGVAVFGAWKDSKGSCREILFAGVFKLPLMLEVHFTPEFGPDSVHIFDVENQKYLP